MLANIINPDQELSFSERRKLLSPPSFSAEELLSGEFFQQYERYFLDQFVLRDAFRSLKAFSKLFLFNGKDNNGLYILDGNIIKIEYPLKEQSVLDAINKFNDIYIKYLTKNTNINYAIIPDKNYFTAPQGNYLSLDYELMISLLNQGLQNMNYIDLFNALSIDDYYRTDIHWDQGSIIHIADLLLKGMGNSARASEGNYTRHELYPFYGSYYGQAALALPAETLVYLTSAVIESAVVYDYESNTFCGVYVPDRFDEMDPYDVFLSGARALITIDNPLAAGNQELIIFRDSFASSITPLLLEGYSKITMIDLRYVTTDLVGEFIQFNGEEDVLFLYGTQVINNSAMLR
jgi:hypothetical protein